MTNEKIPYKIYLSENELPKQWYNVRADMKNKPAPLISPAAGEPLKQEELEPVFCRELVKQELNDTDAYIDIPELNPLKREELFFRDGLRSAQFYPCIGMRPLIIVEDLSHPADSLCFFNGLRRKQIFRLFKIFPD